MGARDQGGAEALDIACRRAVEPRASQDRFHGGSRRWQGGSGAIPAGSSDESRKADGGREQVQGGQMPLRHASPFRGLLATVLLCALVAPVVAQPKKGGGKQTAPVATD